MNGAEEVEAVLRSLVSTTKNGVLLSDLNAEYHDMVGSSIPFREFGFRSLEAYIRSIPHVVHLQMDQNGQLTVHVVSSSAMEHITKMVAAQKSTAPKYRRGARAGSAFSPRRGGNRQQRFQNTTSPPRNKNTGRRRDRRRTPYSRSFSDRTQDFQHANEQREQGQASWLQFLKVAGLKHHFAVKYAALFHELNLSLEDLDMCTAFDLEQLGMRERRNVNLVLNHINHSGASMHFRRCPNCRSFTQEREEIEYHLTEDKKVTWHVGKLLVTVENEYCRVNGATG